MQALQRYDALPALGEAYPGSVRREAMKAGMIRSDLGSPMLVAQALWALMHGLVAGLIAALARSSHSKCKRPCCSALSAPNNKTAQAGPDGSVSVLAQKIKLVAGARYQLDFLLSG